ncbi:MAG: hypothetical protein LBS36_01550 [Oscillospiraceae bacterium]|nr:hypothetical protein [Oscillospiraceae bacterium]
MASKPKEPKFLNYKGKPLVRSGNFLYYGSMAEDYVIMIQVLSNRKIGDFEVADRVTVQLLNTDPDVRPKDKIVKKSEKKGLYAAMDIGTVWLERALENRA